MGGGASTPRRGDEIMQSLKNTEDSDDKRDELADLTTVIADGEDKRVQEVTEGMKKYIISSADELLKSQASDDDMLQAILQFDVHKAKAILLQQQQQQQQQQQAEDMLPKASYTSPDGPPQLLSVTIFHRHGSRGPGESELKPWTDRKHPIVSQWNEQELEVCLTYDMLCFRTHYTSPPPLDWRIETPLPLLAYGLMIPNFFLFYFSSSPLLTLYHTIPYHTAPRRTAMSISSSSSPHPYIGYYC